MGAFDKLKGAAEAAKTAAEEAMHSEGSSHQQATPQTTPQTTPQAVVPEQQPPVVAQPVAAQPVVAQNVNVQSAVLRCPQCGGTNVNVQLINDGMVTKKKSRSGLRKLGRATMVASTMGLWALTSKGSGKNKTQMSSHKEAVCQSCGNSWEIK
ncbi:MAG: hypothetical protein LKJ44_06005 [Bifidobacteriaceae bacterium]|nr:hypothetical protein [Bifidobacteriaceae bacterium]MCI1979249.1 hypothetical protein [Bifidobacteriaceae bacterium]